MGLWKSKYNIHEDIALLHKELETISEVKEFVQTKMWIRICDMMIAKIKNYDNSIVTLSANPEKNKEEIKSKHSLRTACKGLIGGIETTLKSEAEIIKRINKLEGKLQLSELTRDN